MFIEGGSANARRSFVPDAGHLDVSDDRSPNANGSLGWRKYCARCCESGQGGRRGCCGCIKNLNHPCRWITRLSLRSALLAFCPSLFLGSPLTCRSRAAVDRLAVFRGASSLRAASSLRRSAVFCWVWRSRTRGLFKRTGDAPGVQFVAQSGCAVGKKGLTRAWGGCDEQPSDFWGAIADSTRKGRKRTGQQHGPKAAGFRLATFRPLLHPHGNISRWAVGQQRRDLEGACIECE